MVLQKIKYSDDIAVVETVLVNLYEFAKNCMGDYSVLIESDVGTIKITLRLMNFKFLNVKMTFRDHEKPFHESIMNVKAIEQDPINYLDRVLMYAFRHIALLKRTNYV